MGELGWNPHVELVLTRRGRKIAGVSVVTPVRGRPLGITQVLPQEREVFAVLRDLCAGRAIDAEIDENSWDRLVDLGVLVPEGKIARPVRFHAAPAALPLDLFPRPAADLPSPERLRVSAGLHFRDAVGPLAEGASPRPRFVAGQSADPRRGGALVNPFAADCAWALVAHAGVPAASALSVRENERDLFRRLVPGAEPPADLSPALRDALARAGVLVDPALEDDRRRELAREQADAARSLRERGYAVVRGLVHPAQIAALRRYYRDLLAEGWVPFGERYWTHNEPMACFLLARLTPFLAAVTAERIKPSYAFLGSYLPGARLTPHRDRAECAFSVSLLVDYQPDPVGPSPWPLRFALARGRKADADLGLGDGVVYRGDELTHFRDPLPAGHASTSVFLHYVAEDFQGPLE